MSQARASTKNEQFEKISKPSEIIKNKEGLLDLAEQVFSVVDKEQERSIGNNKEISERINDESVFEACEQADLEIKAVSEKTDSKLLKLFDSLMDKADLKWNKFKNKKNLSKLNENILKMSAEVYGAKLSKYRKLSDKGDSKKLDKYYQGYHQRLDKYFENYKKLNPDYLQDYVYRKRDLENNLKNCFENFLNYKFSNSSSDEMLGLLDFGSPLKANSYVYDSLAQNFSKRIKKLIQEEAGLGDNDEKLDELLREKLTGREDIYLLILNNSGYYERIELVFNNRFLEPLKKVAANPEYHYALDSIRLRDDVDRSSLTPDLVKTCFNYYLKNNPELIKKNIEIFQGEIDNLNPEERKNFFSGRFTHRGEARELGACVKLNEEEFNVCLDVIGNIYNSDLSREEKLNNIRNYTSENKIFLLTNAENCGLTLESQEEILSEIVSLGRVIDFVQLMTYPEKYPDLGKERIINAFNTFVSSHGDSSLLEKILLNNIPLSKAERESLIDSCFNGESVYDVFNFLSYSWKYLSDLECDKVEKMIIERLVVDNDGWLNFDKSSNLLKFRPENLQDLLATVNTVSVGSLISLIICDDNILSNDQLAYLLARVDDPFYLLMRLNVNVEEEVISAERKDKLTDLALNSWSLEKIIQSGFLANDEARQSEIINFRLERGDFEDLKEIVHFTNNNTFKLSSEKKHELCLKVVAKLDFNDSNSIFSRYCGYFKENLKYETDNELVEILLKEKNYNFAALFLERDLTAETYKELVDGIIKYGDSKAQLALANNFSLLEGRNTKADHFFSNEERIERGEALINKIIEEGSSKALIYLLYRRSTHRETSEKLSPEQVVIIKTKILDSNDVVAIEDLFRLSYTGVNFDFNDREKEKIINIVIDSSENYNYSYHLLKLVKEGFNLQSDQTERLLTKLSKLSAHYFIEILEENIYEKFLDFDSKKIEKIITEFISNTKNGLNLFSMYVRANFKANLNHENERLGEVLNKNQFGFLVEKIINSGEISSESDWPGKFLSEYIQLNLGNKDKEGEKKFHLSDYELSSLIFSYIKAGDFKDQSQFKLITSSYPDEFEREMLKCLENGYNDLFVRAIKNNSEYAKNILSRNRKIILEKINLLSENNSEAKTVTRFYNLLGKFGLFDKNCFEGLNKSLESQANERDRILNFSEFFQAVTSGENIKVIDELVGHEISGKIQEFKDKYKISGKGETLLNLIAAKEYGNVLEMEIDSPLEITFENIEKALSQYEKVLSLHDANSVPEGIRVSIGMEYEVTDTIALRYEQKTKNDYKTDINRLSSIAGIGEGSDAVHEFALRPTDNPYLALLELKLLQDLNYIDFNFKSPRGGGYAGSSSGYHVTISGEEGIYLNEHTQFLQNIILTANLGGVYTGSEVSRVGRGRGSIRDRGVSNNNVKVFENLKNAVELRALSVDKWEQFERATLVNYNGALAIQAFTKYTNLSHIKLAEVPDDKLNSAENFYSYLKETGLLKEEPRDERVKDIIFEWSKLQIKIMRAADDHNQNFIDNETYGYLDEDGAWVDAQDFTRGRNNKTAFQDVISQTALGKNEYFEIYFEKNLQINIGKDFYEEISVDFANRLTRLNNLYIKGDVVNINNMFGTTVENGIRILKEPDDAEKSIFDLYGQIREGRYYVQGSSDKMIINVAQSLLLDFNKKMQKILKKSAIRKVEDLAA